MTLSAQTSSKWPKVRFGDVVRNVDESVRDPQTCGLERYVGLEHIDPESLHVQHWGLIAEGTTFTRRFRKGQVLFGKRRAYQRKVAVAEFDGLCSSDILVFEPKDENLLPELLPFICQTERFFEHALDTSAGSLSPRTKFKELARYEFPLPTLDEQRRIAEILWAADEVIERYKKCISLQNALKQTLLVNLNPEQPGGNNSCKTSIGYLPRSWKVLPLGDILIKCQYGLSIPLKDKGEYPILRMNNILDGQVTSDDLKYVDLSIDEFHTYQLFRGDILFNRTNSLDLVGKVGIFDLDGQYVFASYLLRLKVDSNVVSPYFINYYLNAPQTQTRISRFATPGVSQANINAKNLQKLLVPVPIKKEQEEWVSNIQSIDDSIKTFQEHLGKSMFLKKSLLSYIQ